jgi:hypothetical protein
MEDMTSAFYRQTGSALMRARQWARMTRSHGFAAFSAPAFAARATRVQVNAVKLLYLLKIDQFFNVQLIPIERRLI